MITKYPFEIRIQNCNQHSSFKHFQKKMLNLKDINLKNPLQNGALNTKVSLGFSHENLGNSRNISAASGKLCKYLTVGIYPRDDWVNPFVPVAAKTA